MTESCYDLALYWLSEQVHVSRSKAEKIFKELVPNPGKSPFYSVIDPLARSGHVEYTTTHCGIVKSGFLVIDQMDNSAEGVLFGQRNSKLLQHLQRSFPQGFTRTPQEYGPQVWHVSGHPQVLRDALAVYSVAWIQSPTALLLPKLPTLSCALLASQRSQLSPSETWECFSDLTWQRTGTTNQPGLYRHLGSIHQLYYRATQGGEIYSLRSKELGWVAKWREAARQHMVILCLRGLNLHLSPNSIFLPLVLDRLLRATSGLPPRKEGKDWVFERIQPPVASEVARILEVSLC